MASPSTPAHRRSVFSSTPVPQGPYWYENLGEQEFQRLCAAIVRNKYKDNDIRCYPVGQKDGGRDIKRTTVNDDLIYQVKWTKNSVKNPVTWLTSAVTAESDNIRRNVAAGASQYILVTSISGTSAMAGPDGRGGGTIDKIDQVLKQFAKHFGLTEMRCWWREDLDAEVLLAPTNIQWRFPKMLAGAEALRFLLNADHDQAKQEQIALIIRKTVSAQWSRDSKVKFKQVELDKDDLEDLFIDVKASQSTPSRLQQAPARLTGALQHIVSSSTPFVLVRGEPGQGKSTLGQQLCQVFRSPFIADGPGVKRPALTAASNRVPVRLDLRDYGSWLEGQDPFAEVLNTKPAKPRTSGGLEHFLTTAFTHWAVVDRVELSAVNDLFTRYPILLVLDGLDEVAQPDTRARVVRHIEEFAHRWRHGGIPPKVVVTTRPNVADLAEPTDQIFEILTLAKLDRALRNEYLRKWCLVRAIKGPDKRNLIHSFDARTAEPHIAQLAENPMQLTILLYLLHLRGQSVPDRRTPLYDDYMRTFLDREAEKSVSVRDNRTNLEEVTAYLGWFLHSYAEQQGGTGRLKAGDLRTEIFRYLDNASKDTGLVNSLFTDVTDRVWALSSKAQGTFEFDVQPVREFFAAKYLSRYASADKSDILNELIRRPFWSNVSRFFAGFTHPNEIGGLVDGLTEEITRGRHPRQARTATWTLLSDGVFSAKPTAQNRAVELLTDELGIRLLRAAMTAGDLPTLPLDSGGAALVTLLLDQAAALPTDPLAGDRVHIAAALNPGSVQLQDWWLANTRPALGGQQETTWLRLGREIGGARLFSEEDLRCLTLVDDNAIAAAISVGLEPPSDSDMQSRFVQAVLRGACSDVHASRTGLVADLINVAAPRQFLALAKPPERAVFETNSAFSDHMVTDVRRADAFRRLKNSNPIFGKIQATMNRARRSPNSVQPWSEAAEHLRSLYGPCWLATDIAVIGAAIDPLQRRDVGPMNPRLSSFGPNIHYGNLVNDIRVHRNNLGWWQQSRMALSGPDLAVWMYSLVAVGTVAVVESQLADMVQAVEGLEPAALQQLLDSSGRLGLSGISRRLPADLISRVSTSTAASLLVMHHADTLTNSSNLSGLLTAHQLQQAAQYGPAAWPALRVVGEELSTTGTTAWLPVLQVFGPHSVAGLAQGPLEPTVAQHILDRPAVYPGKWIELADLVVSRANSENDLLTCTPTWFE